MKKLSIYAIAGVLAAIIAVAATVNYLSNATTYSTGVDSPLATASSLDGTNWYLGVSDVTKYGGESSTYQVRVVNRADATIPANIVTNVTNNQNAADCYDFRSIDVEVAGAWQNVWDGSSGSCANQGDGTFKVTIPAVYVPLETEYYNVSATYVTNVQPAAYTFTTQALV